MNWDIAVVGTSLGGLDALTGLLSGVSKAHSCPILVVQHLNPDSSSNLAQILATRTALHVEEAVDKALLLPGSVTIAPPDYHMLCERNVSSYGAGGPGTAGGELAPGSAAQSRSYRVGLSQDAPECCCRPAADVLFESAAVATAGRVLGIVLTGSNQDGARGALCIKDWGGTLLVQDPSTAKAPQMPLAVLEKVVPDLIGTPEELSRYLTFQRRR